jgi:biopolymer transport protein ExbD
MALRLASDSEDLAVAHEINVTPFIDVMLVLLIIFMVAAPLATVDVKVDLPVSNEDEVRLAALGAAITEATAGDREERVFLRADKAITYDEIMQAMNALRAAGYVHVALVGAETGAAAP